MHKRDKDNRSMEEAYERFKKLSDEQLMKIAEQKSPHIHMYFKKGLNRVLKERGLREV